MGAWDWQPIDECMIGVSVAGMDNYLKWHDHRGQAHMACAKLGIYSSYCGPINPCLSANFFIDGLVTGGYNWTKAHRGIKFPGIDREAHSRQNGYDVAVHAQGGCNLPFSCWLVSPLVRLSYFYVRENGFSEKGAEKLKLKVRGFHAQTFRSNLGVGINRTFDFPALKLSHKSMRLGYMSAFSTNAK